MTSLFAGSEKLPVAGETNGGSIDEFLFNLVVCLVLSLLWFRCVIDPDRMKYTYSNYFSEKNKLCH
jgi:hypothetical protein